MDATDRRFLLLQGPHGPFMAALGAELRARRAVVWKVVLNGGDAAEWRGPGLVPLDVVAAVYPRALAALMDDLQITDVVLYGEARPVHRAALAAARARKLDTHLLEEGYLRPAWITYERAGTNDRSPARGWDLDQLPPADPAEVTDGPGGPKGGTPARWGNLRRHVLYGVRHHLALMAGARRFRQWQPHRGLPVAAEAQRALAAAAGLPGAMVWRAVAQRRILAARAPLYVLLLQLQHDMAMRAPPEVADHAALLKRVLASFAAHAPDTARLAVKMHPLEPQRQATARLVRSLAARHGLRGRVAALPGGRLAPLLDRTAAALTVDSTAGQQVLWRWLPLFAFGAPVYDHPSLLPERDLDRFLADPQPPCRDRYARFRAELLRTSQVRGSFYTAAGRQQALAGLVPRMLSRAVSGHAVAVRADDAQNGGVLSADTGAEVSPAGRTEVLTPRIPGSKPGQTAAPGKHVYTPHPPKSRDDP